MGHRFEKIYYSSIKLAGEIIEGKRSVRNLRAHDDIIMYIHFQHMFYGIALWQNNTVITLYEYRHYEIATNCSSIQIITKVLIIQMVQKIPIQVFWKRYAPTVRAIDFSGGSELKTSFAAFLMKIQPRICWQTALYLTLIIWLLEFIMKVQ